MTHSIQSRACRAPAIANTDRPKPDFRTDLVALIPFLRAFARSLCGHRDMADDLAQDTLARAWQARGSFVPGTNMKAWLFTILRNQFYSDRRRAWRQMACDQDLAERIPGNENQLRDMDLTDTARALRTLGAEQREALILVGAGGFSYEEAAAVMSCPVGTVKSRVARARTALLEILDGTRAVPGERRPSDSDAMEQILDQLDRLMAVQTPSRGTDYAPGP